jgi:hypothetical protein
MKNSRLALIFILLGLVLTAVSCKKDTGTKFSSMDEFLQTVRPQKQTFKIQSSTGGTFTTAKGWKFTFSGSNLFSYKNNLTPYNGEVTVEIIEMKTKTDILFSNTTTADVNGKPLVSGGMFNINLKTSTGEPLIFEDFVNVFIPDANPDPQMSGYIGVDSSVIAWVPTDSSVLVNPITQGYNLNFAGNLNWVNVDLPFTDSFCEIILNMTNLSPDFANSWILIKNLNTCVQLKPISNSASYQYMPTNQEALFISYTIKNNQLYAVTKQFNVNTNTTFNLTFEPTLIADLQSIVNAF